MKNRTKLIRAIPAVLAALALALLAACGNVGGSDQASEGGGGPTVTIGSKNFTEQYILGELYAQALEANGFNVEKKLDLGSEQIADKALQNGQIDMYPEYTGTSLVATLDYPGDPADLKTPEETRRPKSSTRSATLPTRCSPLRPSTTATASSCARTWQRRRTSRP
jgi:osmoprotectant transport system substrate-binding protein